MEYADMLGLPPMVAMTGIHVIEGKPTASSGLISGLVRKARHRLRVTGDDKHAVAEITRSDDPDFTFRSEWTLDRAKQAELLGKSNWKKYPAAMLKARAITEAARDACEEALFGLQYTPEELGAEVDEDGNVVEAEIVDESAAPEDPWAVRPSPEQEWLAAAVKAASGHASIEACKVAWQKSAGHVNDRTLTRAEVIPLQNALRARMETLKAAEETTEPLPCEADVIEGEIVGLDVDDDWRDRVADIKDPAEADAVIADASDQLGREVLTAEHYARIAVAVETRLAELAAETKAAA
jgi:hypothetical protein